jgi:transcription elongation GreA/GreB family factor
MDKRRVVEQITAYLAEELAGILKAAESARQAATHEESRSEDRHDTRAIEAGYLAGAQAQRAAELQQLLLMYRFLPLRELGPDDVASPAALVELETRGTRAFYFIAPQGGGLVTRVDDRAVQVITPNSPIGEALLGKRVGDRVEVEIRDSIREYRVISIS